MNRALKANNDDLYMELIKFGQLEKTRRKEAPVLVKLEDYEEESNASDWTVFLIDPRLGFNNRTNRFWINKLPPGGEEGQRWKTLGHRHTVEAVIYWLTGHGYSIIDGITYRWKAGDFVCVPMFAWHRHVNESDERAFYVASTTGPLSMGLGQAVYEDEQHPQFFVFAQQGAEAMRSLQPGGAIDAGSLGAHQTKAQSLYAEQVSFGFEEEARRRKGRVLVTAEEVQFESTVMGDMAYVVDPRLGFHVKAIATVLGRVPAGKHSGSHRHLYDEINYVTSGRGTMVIDDESYEIKRGDAVCVPAFAWHQYFASTEESLHVLSHSTRPALENLGLVLTQHGENADY